jgi:hypothetical protein
MQVFRTYLQSIKKIKNVFQYISQGHSSRINGRSRCSRGVTQEQVLYLATERDKVTDVGFFIAEKSTFDYFCFI